MFPTVGLKHSARVFARFQLYPERTPLKYSDCKYQGDQADNSPEFSRCHHGSPPYVLINAPTSSTLKRTVALLCSYIAAIALAQLRLRPFIIFPTNGVSALLNKRSFSCVMDSKMPEIANFRA
jgi:hypothetical protein